jgi:hypothetical protein
MPRKVPALNRSSECAGSGWSAVISIRPSRRRLRNREGFSTSRSPRLNRQDGLSLLSRPCSPCSDCGPSRLRDNGPQASAGQEACAGA